MLTCPVCLRLYLYADYFHGRLILYAYLSLMHWNTILFWHVYYACLYARLKRGSRMVFSLCGCSLQISLNFVWALYSVVHSCSACTCPLDVRLVQHKTKQRSRCQVKIPNSIFGKVFRLVINQNDSNFERDFLSFLHWTSVCFVIVTIVEPHAQCQDETWKLHLVSSLSSFVQLCWSACCFHWSI